MQFTVTIDLDNDYFSPDPLMPLAALLRTVYLNVANQKDEGSIMDGYGNTVGYFGILDKPESNPELAEWLEGNATVMTAIAIRLASEAGMNPTELRLNLLQEAIDYANQCWEVAEHYA